MDGGLNGRLVRTAGDLKQRGFSLLELAIVIGIVGLVLGGLLRPLAARMELKAVKLERETLLTYERAVIGYAMANGRLPIPDSPTQDGSDIFGTFPFDELGITNVSGKEYRYVADREFLHRTQPGMRPAPNQLDMTDGDARAFRLEVSATLEAEVSREISGHVVIERLVTAGQLP